MAEPIRCPDCGASNQPGAAWCGQCLRRFDAETASKPGASVEAGSGADTPAAPAPPGVPSEPSPPAAPGPALAAVPPARGGVRREGDTVVWTCPACDNENPMDLLQCSVCGTPLAKLFVAETPPRAGERSRASLLGMSAALPGAAHMALGMTAAGLGRAVLYLWTLVVGVFLVLRNVRKNAAMVHGLGFVFILAAVAVWVMSYIEASRASQGDRTLIAEGRALTWATAALTFLLFVGLAMILRSR